MKILYSKDLDRAVVVNTPHEEQALPSWAGFRVVEQFTPSKNFPKRFYNFDTREERTVCGPEEEGKLPRGWFPAGG